MKKGGFCSFANTVNLSCLLQAAALLASLIAAARCVVAVVGLGAFVFQQQNNTTFKEDFRISLKPLVNSLLDQMINVGDTKAWTHANDKYIDMPCNTSHRTGINHFSRCKNCR